MRILSAVKQSRLARVGLIGVVVAAGAVGLSGCWSPSPCTTRQPQNSQTGFDQYQYPPPATITGAQAGITWSPPQGACTGDDNQTNNSTAWVMVAGTRSDNGHNWYAQVGIEDWPNVEKLVGHACYFAEYTPDASVPSDDVHYDVCNNPNPAGVQHQFAVEPVPGQGNVLGMFVDGVEIYNTSIVPTQGVWQGTYTSFMEETGYQETSIGGTQSAPTVFTSPQYQQAFTHGWYDLTDSVGAWITSHPGGAYTDTLAQYHTFGTYQN